MRSTGLAYAILTTTCCVSFSAVASGNVERYAIHGIVRDFQESHPDFQLVYGDGMVPSASNIQLTLDEDGKPVFVGEGGTILIPAMDRFGRKISPYFSTSSDVDDHDDDGDDVDHDDDDHDDDGDDMDHDDDDDHEDGDHDDDDHDDDDHGHHGGHGDDDGHHVDGDHDDDDDNGHVDDDDDDDHDGDDAHDDDDDDDHDGDDDDDDGDDDDDDGDDDDFEFEASDCFVANDTPATMSDDNSGGVQSSSSFSQWFRSAPGTNASKLQMITLNRLEDNSFLFTSDDWKPIDGDLYRNESSSHNRNFTFQVDAQVDYSECAGGFLQVGGAGDVWVFIDGRLVIDMGGQATGDSQVIEFDRLGLDEGRHNISIFYAQRTPDVAPFSIHTNMWLMTRGAPSYASEGLYD